jgi:hypothetical protein
MAIMSLQDCLADGVLAGCLVLATRLVGLVLYDVMATSRSILLGYGMSELGFAFLLFLALG